MRHNPFFAIVFAGISLCHIPLAQSQTVAIVNEIQGRVSIIRAAGDTVKAKQFARLYKGDMIRVFVNGEVTLLLQGGKTRKIYENTDFTVHPDKNQKAQKNLIKEIWELLMGKTDVMKGKQATGAVRGADVVTSGIVQPNFPMSWRRSDKTIRHREILLSPRSGKVSADNLQFTWKSVTGISKYELVIFDTIGTEVFNAVLSDTNFTPGQQDQLLKAGNFYKCWLRGFASQHYFYDSGTFYILASDEAAGVEQEKNLILGNYSAYDNFGQHVILAAFYEKHAMFIEAERTLLELKATEDDNPHFWYLLANLHQTVGLKLLAENERLLAARLMKKE